MTSNFGCIFFIVPNSSFDLVVTNIVTGNLDLTMTPKLTKNALLSTAMMMQSGGILNMDFRITHGVSEIT